MKIYQEKSLRDFEFWSGAKDRAGKLTSEQLDIIEGCFEESYPDGMDETKINDIFWFDFDWIVNLLGYGDEEMFDFCNEFETEERLVEIGDDVYTLEISHDEDSTTISDDISCEEMDVENGESVEDAITRYEKLLRESIEEDEEESEDE